MATPGSFRMLALTAVAVGVIAAGCSGSGASAVIEPAAAFPSSSGLTDNLTLPIETYLVKLSDRRRYGAGLDVLVSECLSQFGFTAGLPMPGPVPAANLRIDAANMPRRYGIANPQDAARYGYHLAANDSGTHPRDTMSTAETEVLFGRAAPSAPSAAGSHYAGHTIADGGCEATEEKAIGGGLNDRIAETIDDTSMDLSVRDPAVTAAIHAWSECMATHGYQFQSPFDPPDGNMMATPVSPAEIRMATTDVACKQRTNLVRIWFDTESAIQQQMITAHQAALSAMKTTNDRILRQAIDVAAGHATHP